MSVIMYINMCMNSDDSICFVAYWVYCVFVQIYVITLPFCQAQSQLQSWLDSSSLIITSLPANQSQNSMEDLIYSCKLKTPIRSNKITIFPNSKSSFLSHSTFSLSLPQLVEHQFAFIFLNTVFLLLMSMYNHAFIHACMHFV